VKGVVTPGNLEHETGAPAEEPLGKGLVLDVKREEESLGEKSPPPVDIGKGGNISPKTN